MSIATEMSFGAGQYWTAKGQRAVVDAVVDDGCGGMLLVGRINLENDESLPPCWHASQWRVNGQSRILPEDSLLTERVPRINKTYWLNIYASGPGQLRKDWEEALVEASRCEEPCLCRVEVKIDAIVGEGLK